MRADISGAEVNRSLATVLLGARSKSRTAIMTDIKFRSARDKQLIEHEDIEEYVEALLEGGVDALSVVTESRHFGGSLTLAARVRRIMKIPIIRKEFFSRIEQMDESAAIGFDAVQLTIRVIKNIEVIARMANRAQQVNIPRQSRGL